MRSENQISFVLLFLIIGLISCDSGQNKQHDCIQLSQKHADLSAQGDSIVISTEGDYWWINDVNADGRYMYAALEDITSDFANIKGEWFSVEKLGKQRLIVKVSENTSKNIRKIIITLESGNYFDRINVFQKGRD